MERVDSIHDLGALVSTLNTKYKQLYKPYLLANFNTNHASKY